MTPYLSPIGFLVAIVFNVILGMVWYSHAVFGKPWMHLMGIKPSKPSFANMLVPVSSSILSTILLAFVFMNVPGTVPQLILVGLWVGVIFTVFTQLPHYLFGKKSLKLFLINSGFDLVSILLTAAAVGLVR